MTPTEFLSEQIAGFPGYADEDGRRMADELVRSYMGEALAELQVRLAPLDAATEGRIGDLLIRIGFTNQSAFRTFLEAARTRTDFDDVAAADQRVVEIADDAGTVDAAGLPAYLDTVVEAFDRRDAVMSHFAAAVS